MAGYFTVVEFTLVVTAIRHAQLAMTYKRDLILACDDPQMRILYTNPASISGVIIFIACISQHCHFAWEIDEF